MPMQLDRLTPPSASGKIGSGVQPAAIIQARRPAMRIMTILGSPRKQGNTAKVLEWVEEQFQSDGHEVDHVFVEDFSIRGCRACWSCQSGKIELCAVQDDANGIFERMIAADAVILAAPVFCWGFPGPMKCLVDRAMCLALDFVSTPDYSTRIQGKPLGLVATCGGPEEGNAEIMIRAFQAMAGFLKASTSDHLLVPFCTEPAAIDPGAKTRAVAFAQAFARAAAP
jgi:multimeric flavodoxin WrbA